MQVKSESVKHTYTSALNTLQEQYAGQTAKRDSEHGAFSNSISEPGVLRVPSGEVPVMSNTEVHIGAL